MEELKREKMKMLNIEIRETNVEKMKLKKERSVSDEARRKRQSSPILLMRNQLLQQYSYHSLNFRLGVKPI